MPRPQPQSGYTGLLLILFPLLFAINGNAQVSWKAVPNAKNKEGWFFSTDGQIHGDTLKIWAKIVHPALSVNGKTYKNAVTIRQLYILRYYVTFQTFQKVVTSADGETLEEDYKPTEFRSFIPETSLGIIGYAAIQNHRWN